MPETKPIRYLYVVDDDEAVRESTRLLLEADGHATIECETAKHFLDVFAAPTAACLIFDIHMPEMNGLALLAEIRIRGAMTPVIIVSGRAEPALAAAAKAAGAFAVLQKPVDDGELLGLVRQALDAAP